MIIEITDADLPAQFQADAMYSAIARGDTDRITQFKAYCREHRILYYARPREDFSWVEALKMAETAGCDKLLLEDLS